MNKAKQEEIARLARKGLSADQIYLRMLDSSLFPRITIDEVEMELAKLGDMSLTVVHVAPVRKTRKVERVEIATFVVEQTWNGKEWRDGSLSRIEFKGQFAEARVGDELRMDRLGQLTEDLLEFAKANATRMEITNAKEEE